MNNDEAIDVPTSVPSDVVLAVNEVRRELITATLDWIGCEFDHENAATVLTKFDEGLEILLGRFNLKPKP